MVTVVDQVVTVVDQVVKVVDQGSRVQDNYRYDLDTITILIES